MVRNPWQFTTPLDMMCNAKGDENANLAALPFLSFVRRVTRATHLNTQNPTGWALSGITASDESRTLTDHAWLEGSQKLAADQMAAMGDGLSIIHFSCCRGCGLGAADWRL